MKILCFNCDEPPSARRLIIPVDLDGQPTTKQPPAAWYHRACLKGREL